MRGKDGSGVLLMACERPGRLLGMCVGVVEGPLAETGVGGCS